MKVWNLYFVTVRKAVTDGTAVRWVGVGQIGGQVFRMRGSAFLQRSDGSENRRQWHPLPHSFSAGTGAGFGTSETLGPKRYLNRMSCIHPRARSALTASVQICTFD
jgi:hypothetical protein